MGCRGESSGRATARPCGCRVADDIAGLGDRCTAQARRFIASSRNLSRRRRNGGARVRFAAKAPFAPRARSPGIRDTSNGRGRRVAHGHPVWLLGRACLLTPVPERRAPRKHGGGRCSAACGNVADAGGTTDRRPLCYAMGMEALLRRCVRHYRLRRRIACVSCRLQQPGNTSCRNHHRNAHNRHRRRLGESANVERGSGARTAHANRHGLGRDVDRASSRLCHQHCGVGSNAHDDRHGNGVAAPFTLATLSALVAIVAAFILLPARSAQQDLAQKDLAG